MASAAPAVRYPNVYGIDMPSPKEFIADSRTSEEIAEVIGADWLIYQELADLIDAVHKGNISIKDYDCSCFDGKYITNDVDENYLKHLDKLRSDVSKHKREGVDDLAGIDLYSSQ